MKNLRQTRTVVSILSWMLALALPAWCETWILKDGSRNEGDFVRLAETHLFIRTDGAVVSIPLELLSKASIDLAKASSRGIRMDFVAIPAGRYQLGVHENKMTPLEKQMPFLKKDMPYRTAIITRPFDIKATEVTSAEWEMILGFAQENGFTDLPRGGNGYKGNDEGTHPVTGVSWWDAVKWCNLLSLLERRKPFYYTGESFDKERVLRAGIPKKIHVDWNANGYRLPTEAEWESAWFSKGLAEGHQNPDGWHQDNSENNTHPVRSRPSATDKPLHDMLGNVAEWCWDWMGPVVASGSDKDPRGHATGSHRIFRGGSWADHAMCCQGGYRGDFRFR